MRAGHYKGWNPLMLLGTDVNGKTLGIIGFGRIGQAVARRAKGLECESFIPIRSEFFLRSSRSWGPNMSSLTNSFGTRISSPCTRRWMPRRGT